MLQIKFVKMEYPAFLCYKYLIEIQPISFVCLISEFSYSLISIWPKKSNIARALPIHMFVYICLNKQNIAKETKNSQWNLCAPKISISSISLHLHSAEQSVWKQVIDRSDCVSMCVCVFVCVHCEQDEACHSREEWSLSLSDYKFSSDSASSSGSHPSIFQFYVVVFFSLNPTLSRCHLFTQHTAHQHLPMINACKRLKIQVGAPY